MGEADVDDRDVGTFAHDRSHECVAVGDSRDDLEPVVAEQSRESVAQERQVFGDHDPHGITARTVVGPPGGLVTLERPIERLDPPREPAAALFLRDSPRRSRRR